MNLNHLKTLTLAESVIKYPELENLFNKYRINYCCNGDDLLFNQLDRINKDIDIEKYLNNDKYEENKNITDLDNNELIDLIINKHHIYELSLIKDIDQLIIKILFEDLNYEEEIFLDFNRKFTELKIVLIEHFVKEENKIFPLILENKDKNKILEEIKILEQEHISIYKLIDEIYNIADDFILPQYATGILETLYSKLEELLEDIFRHIHKENNILFKRFNESMSLKDRKEIIKHLLRRLHKGDNKDKVKEEFIINLSKVSSEEIAEAEKELIIEGVPIEEIQNLCDIHASIFEGNIEDKIGTKEYEYGHPAFVFLAENDGIIEFIDKELKENLNNYLMDKTSIEYKKELVFSIDKLLKIDLHYKRKENLLFPYLEKENITAPPKVMWGVDDDIRELLKLSRYFIENEEMDIDDMLDEAILKIESMVTKEKTILLPLLEEIINSNDWLLIAKESEHIGYVFNDDIEGASLSDIRKWILDNEGKAYIEKTYVSDINLPSGNMNLKELELILNKIPIDITFVDSDGYVKYFSENEDRVFPRTRTIIGRDVNNCHPQKSLDIVNEIIKDFKNGNKDEELFFIDKNNKFIVIKYFALRDENGKYLGVLETTQETSELRNLKGNKTLIDRRN